MTTTDIGIRESTTGTSAPKAITLDQNYPNPFNLNTVISYRLSMAHEVTVSIFNLNGQLVQTLFSGKQNAGMHQVVWNGRDESGRWVPAGVYFVRLRDGVAQTQKMVIVLQ